MQEICCFLGALACAVSIASAADIDIFIGSGFGFPFDGNPAFSSDKFDNSITPYESDDKYLNVGKGLKLDLGAQVGNLEKVMFRIGFATSFLTSGPIEEDVGYLDLGVFGQSTTTTTHEYSVQIIGGRALVIPHFALTDAVSVYAGLGGGLFYAFGESEIAANTVTTAGNSTTTSSTHQTFEYENKPFPGLLSVLGIRLDITGPIAAMAEVGYDVMNVTVDELKHTDTDGTITTTNYERDATDREAPPKIPATNVALRAAVIFAIP